MNLKWRLHEIGVFQKWQNFEIFDFGKFWENLKFLLDAQANEMPRQRIRITKDGKYSQQEFSFGAELFIRNLTARDAGEWKCKAENFVDNIQTILGVTVEEKKEKNKNLLLI